MLETSIETKKFSEITPANIILLMLIIGLLMFLSLYFLWIQPSNLLRDAERLLIDKDNNPATLLKSESIKKLDNIFLKHSKKTHQISSAAREIEAAHNWQVSFERLKNANSPEEIRNAKATLDEQQAKQVRFSEDIQSIQEALREVDQANIFNMTPTKVTEILSHIETDSIAETEQSIISTTMEFARKAYIDKKWTTPNNNNAVLWAEKVLKLNHSHEGAKNMIITIISDYLSYKSSCDHMLDRAGNLIGKGHGTPQQKSEFNTARKKCNVNEEGTNP